MATSRRVGNYATSANAVIRNSDAIFDAAMSGKPDFTKISKEAIKGRSLERRAVTKAEADVASAGLKAFTDVNLTRMREDTKKDVADILRPAKRMAGIVGGLGAIAGGYVMMEGNKKDKAEREAFKAEQNAVFAKQSQMQSDFQTQQRGWMKKLEESFGSSGNSSDAKPSESGTATSGSTPAPAVSPGGTTPPSTTHVPVNHSSSTRITQQQGTQLLIDQGMDPENARIGGAIMMAESHGDPGALNPDGEYSLGLWQHNRDTGEDRHSFYGIQDWSELSDPETNARATYKLWKRQGGWTPWGAYTNGSYTKFLK